MASRFFWSLASVPRPPRKVTVALILIVHWCSSTCLVKLPKKSALSHSRTAEGHHLAPQQYSACWREHNEWFLWQEEVRRVQLMRVLHPQNSNAIVEKDTPAPPSCIVIFHLKDVVAWLAQWCITHSWTERLFFLPRFYEVDVGRWETNAENSPQLLPSKWLSSCSAVLKTSSDSDFYKEIARSLKWFLGCMDKSRIKNSYLWFPDYTRE